MHIGSDFIGKPIFTVDKGKKIGIVKDIYFDWALESLKGVFLGLEGLLRQKTRFIDAGDIVELGHDALLVDRADVKQVGDGNGAYRDWLRRQRVIGRPITTSGGTLIGSVGDVYLSSSGAVRAVALAKVQFKSPVASAGYVMRDVVLDVGDDDVPMKVNLAKAERHFHDLFQAV